MASQFKKSVLRTYATVSDQLRQTREEKKIALPACARAIQIQEQYLVALESSHYEELPGEMYIKAWIKKYATYLDLDVDDILISYEKEKSLRKKIDDLQEVQESHIQTRRIWDALTFKRILIGVISLLVVGYVSFFIYQSLRPPALALDLPSQSFQTQEASATLSGVSEDGALIAINNQSIPLDDAYRFEEEITLNEGINTVIISAKKKHGWAETKEIRIIKTKPPTLQETGP